MNAASDVDAILCFGEKIVEGMIRKAATPTVAQRGQNQEYMFPVTIASVGSLDEDKHRVRCKSWHFRGQQIPMTSSWGPNFANFCL
jgi:hypothetical protein